MTSRHLKKERGRTKAYSSFTARMPAEGHEKSGMENHAAFGVPV